MARRGHRGGKPRAGCADVPPPRDRLHANVLPFGSDSLDPSLAALRARLPSFALVRLSQALWRGERKWPDVLGCAVRFTRSPATAAALAPGDQDLLFATIRTPWRMPLSPLATDLGDVFANEFFAVSPFSIGPSPREDRGWYFRSPRRSGEGSSRCG